SLPYKYRFMTLKIHSEKNKKLDEFIDLSTSLYFHISYNNDVSIVSQRTFEDLIRHTRINSIRKTREDYLEPPKRSYLADIVYHYQQAVASENPALAFLSYYHVLEHFFESVFEEDLIDIIKTRLTHPQF